LAGVGRSWQGHTDFVSIIDSAENIPIRMARNNLDLGLRGFFLDSTPRRILGASAASRSASYS
jgi:hypothetical protein